jgi:RNA polymerase sigma-70 factor (ECF subfamily)
MHRTALHDLYEAHLRDVYGLARFLTASDAAAAEITSETFLRAWVGRERIRVQTAKAYLLAIARNPAHDRGRLAGPLAAAEVPDHSVEPNAESGIERRRTFQAIRAFRPGTGSR